MLAAILSIVIIIACNTSNSIQQAPSSPFKNVYGDANYVGGDICASCHNEQHSTFKHTGMGQSFDSATKDKSAANFSNAYVYDSTLNLHYSAFWKRNEMYIAEYRISNSDTVHYREEKVNYIIGSGQHTNSHFWSDNGFIYQAPMTWYVQESKWGLPPGYETNNIRFSRKIGQECMTCHNSLPKMVSTSTHKYIDIPKGISCERCHGPGSIHVEEKKKGIKVDTSKGPDYSIVNPKRLPWQLQIDICQRCHLQGNAILAEGKTFDDFRPGMPLSNIMQVYLPVYSNNNHGFVMASHAERFKMSKCFIASNGSEIETYNPDLNFTCINCHNPHLSVKETDQMQFNVQCHSCHGSTRNKQCTESIKERESVNDNCVNCHMPLTGAEDIPHVAIHDHFIRKPSKSKPATGKLKGLVSVNGGDTSQISKLMAYMTYFEKFDGDPFYQTKADEIAAQLNMDEFNSQNVHYWYNKGKFDRVVALSKNKNTSQVNKHFTAYQIGQSYFNELKYSKSLEWFNLAIEMQYQNIEYQIARIRTYLALNQLQNAKSKLFQINKLQAKNPRIYYLKGILLLAEGQNDKAKIAFSKAIQLNPDFKEALEQLSQLD